MTSSTRCSVSGSVGCVWFSQAVATPLGVVGSPSPVCQTPKAGVHVPPPARHGPAGAVVHGVPFAAPPTQIALTVWKPHRPRPVLYSHSGLLLGEAAVLAEWRNALHPPLFWSKVHGTRCVSLGLVDTRMPRSGVPAGLPGGGPGRMSRSVESRVLLLFRS